MDAPEPPPAPDPYKTAQAQAKFNKETAISQFGLNAVNQKTPYGSLSYKQVGTWEDGTPRFEATTELSGEQQDLYNLGSQTSKNLGQAAVDQSGRVMETLGKPIELSNEAAEARLSELGRSRLDPQYEQRQKALETQLIGKGVRPGSEAWAREMTALGQQRNDAYNSLYLSGRGQAMDELLTERNQTLNEIAALMSGSKVEQPRFTNTPQTGVAPTDFIGAQQQSLNQGNLKAQMEAQQNQAMMNGLFGLGKTALGGWMMGPAAAATGGMGLPSGVATGGLY